MKRKSYEKELRKLQVKLCLLQDWVKEKAHHRTDLGPKCPDDEIQEHDRRGGERRGDQL